MFKIFQYNNANGIVELATPEILLVKEFAALLEPKRNVCAEDKTGKRKLRAFREFTYIWLAIDWQSIYADYSEQERHKEALKDAHLTEAEWNDPTFRAACRKYKAIQEENRTIKMLKSALGVIDKITLYFNNLDPEERDEATGKPIFKVKDIQEELTRITKTYTTLKELETMVKKEISEQSSIRAGAVDGYTPRG